MTFFLFPTVQRLCVKITTKMQSSYKIINKYIFIIDSNKIFLTHYRLFFDVKPLIKFMKCMD